MVAVEARDHDRAIVELLDLWRRHDEILPVDAGERREVITLEARPDDGEWIEVDCIWLTLFGPDHPARPMGQDAFVQRAPGWRALR